MNECHFIIEVFPWCSWLSRKPNMLEVLGSNPGGNNDVNDEQSS